VYAAPNRRSPYAVAAVAINTPQYGCGPEPKP